MNKFGQRHIREAEELNITAFMNLMVILVPFLLITAVFSRMTVLELNLPGPNDKPDQDDKIKLSLQLVVYPNRFDIQDANIGIIKRIERPAEGVKWNHFSNILVEIKRRFPEQDSITLLIDPAVDYKTMIAVMDHVRSAEVAEGLSVETVELFPNISIGDAPPDTASTATTAPATATQTPAKK